jgi:hypothetical protein
MARFYSSAENTRGNQKTAIIPAGGEVHTRGWDLGVKVIPRDEDGRDVFDLYATSGSHGGPADRLLGTVRATCEWAPVTGEGEVKA